MSKAPIIPKSYTNQNKWEERDDPLYLLTLEELHSLPPKTIVHSISYTDTCVKDADDDTRFGYTAYGFYESELDTFPFPDSQVQEVEVEDARD